MNIELYDESRQKEWDAFVENSKNGTFLFSRDFMDYHSDRFQDHSLMVGNDKGTLVALLPANRTGKELVSHGGLTYGGFITADTMKTPLMLEVFEGVLNFSKALGFDNLVYKTIPHIYPRGFAEEDRYALFLCDARLRQRDALAVVDARRPLPFQERRRRSVDKAVKQGLTVARSDDYAGYWKILNENLSHRYETKAAHSVEEIELLSSRFPDNIKLFGAFRGADLMGGVVIFESERVAHVQYIAANEEGKNQGALDLAFDHLLSEIYREKAYFDFGASNTERGRMLNIGLIDHKEGFGARAVAHDHYEINLSEWTPDKIRGART